MTFISYSQNREDVLLWRALKAIPHGFYIDVGANDPDEDSVTKAFYDRGWHGINIEPLPSHHRSLQEQRPHDINLLMAAGSSDGALELFDVPAIRGWATSSLSVAQMHRDQGHVVEASTVPVRRLRTICEEWVTGDIHFLKIDVEGFEADVISGMDFACWRPWVVVVEATLPGSEVSSHAHWEPVLTNSRYQMAHFDGLNRFYIAEEHAELAAAFATPPNVFDNYVFVGQVNAEQTAQAMAGNAERERTQARAEIAEARAAFANAQAAQVMAETRLQVLDFQVQSLDARLQAAQAGTVTANAHRQTAETRALLGNANLLLAQQIQLHAETQFSKANQETQAALAETRWAVHQAEHAQASAAAATILAEHAQALMATAETRAQITDHGKAELQMHLDAVYRSKSWQVTTPLRFALRVLRGLRSGAVQRRLRQKFSPVARPTEPVKQLTMQMPAAAPVLTVSVTAAPHATRLTAAAARVLQDIERTIGKVQQ